MRNQQQIIIDGTTHQSRIKRYIEMKFLNFFTIVYLHDDLLLGVGCSVKVQPKLECAVGVGWDTQLG